ncbi:hypothetical protein [Cellulosimicrobium sp. Marseille-Q4280]|uniref:hypothetical protein n=1 Tax=Cellulosimicrobium sp. Marseille-Q4280 TaxID=2937992 RepID=UPI002040C9DD|nr:hypothetical protein [Cellulosimicrobium sp. Marseille-Q4280]
MSPAQHRTDWVQPILVDKNGTHEHTVAAAAHAAAQAYVEATPQTLPAFDAWLDGPFTKTVRRAPAAWLDRARTELGGTGVAYGGSAAVALPPVRMSELPKIVAKAQVAGTDFERTRPALPPAPPVGLAEIAVLNTLTTGKAAAQAAHALVAWVLDDRRPEAGADRLVPSHVSLAMLADPAGLRVRFVPAHELHSLEVPANVAIRDNGLTEVDPHTLTAVAVVEPGYRRIR